MSRDVVKCKFCSKVAREKSRKNFGNKVIITLECGHSIIRDQIKLEGYAAMVSRDGKSPYPFQSQTADFADKANVNYICGHEMGLGKTVIECILLSRHIGELKPVLGVCKAGLRMQWWTELYRWAGIMAQIIESSNDKPDFDMFDVILVSFDTLRLIKPVVSETERMIASARGKKSKAESNKVWGDDICSRFNHIFIDETQQIKNPTSARTRSLFEITKGARLEKGSDGTYRPKKNPPRIAGYSGTPIKSRPSEFWTMLHLVNPEMFPYYDNYTRREIKYSYETGKEIGLLNPEGFHKKIENFFIRFERSEVLPDLPRINRMFQLADMEDDFMKVYKNIVKEFQEFMDIQEKSPSSVDLLGWFSRMRHITGMAKVNEAVEFIEQFLLENDRKIVIFYHHIEVMKAMCEKLGRVMQEGAWEPPLALTSDLDMRQRHEMLENFKDPKNRVLIASQQAAGEGLNMQFCSDCLMMERQWTPAAEEQCEARFPRPGSTADVVNVWYLIAAGTIDEFLTQLVEEKRAIFKQVMDKVEMNWETSTLWADLAEVIRVKGLRKFSKA